MNVRCGSTGRPGAPSWRRPLAAAALALALAGALTGRAAADAPAAAPLSGAAGAQTDLVTEAVAPLASTGGIDVVGPLGDAGLGAGPGGADIDAGAPPAEAAAGAVADAVQFHAPYVERVWTADRYGRPKQTFAHGESARLYLAVANPGRGWQAAWLRLAVRPDIVCITVPCVGPETVLLQGWKWFPPGRAIYYLPVVVEPTDDAGHWLFEARVGASSAQARFDIVAGVPGGTDVHGVIVYDGAEYTGRAIVVGAGNWRLPTGFRPRSLRFGGAHAAGWRADLYSTICPFVPPCTEHHVATYGTDQPDLGEVGTAPYRLSVHR